MIDFMIEARKQNNTIKVRFGRVLFSGSSRAGKTTFYKLLMNKQRVDKHISTGLAQSEQVIAAMKVDAHSKDECVELYELNIKDEILKLRSLLDSMASKQANSKPKMTDRKEIIPCKTELEMARESLVWQTSKSEMLINQSEKKDEMNIFTFMDTGGQPQFISMIPAVNSSAMVTFVVHDVQNSLNDKVTVTHGDEHGKQTFIPYTIGCTNLELIKSLVSFTNNTLLRKRPFLEEISENKSKESISYLSFIGSHLDKALAIKNDDGSIHDIDENLDTVLNDTGLQHVWMNVHPKYKYLIPVNSLTSQEENEYGTHDYAKKIRKKLYDKILEQEVYNVPIVWLLLELEIRNNCKKQRFITYPEIVNLCKQHDLIKNEDDIKNGLRFHHLFGVLLYFDEIPELCNYIFTDYQWVFDNLTKIVYQSYLNCKDNLEVETDFKWRGFFTESLLDKCDMKLKHKSESSLEETEIDFKQGFIKLLEYLRIIAPLKQNEGSVMYFMPSLLSNCYFGDDEHDFSPEMLPENTFICDKSEPLLIQFKPHENIGKTGSFPRGVFPCLIVELLHETSKWQLYWSRKKEKVFDNLVTLIYLETGQYFTFIDRIFYLEVIMLQRRGKTANLIHYKIKQILYEALSMIGRKLNFNKFVLIFGFICHQCLDVGEHILLEERPYATAMCCRYGHLVDKTDKYTLWDKVHSY